MSSKGNNKKGSRQFIVTLDDYDKEGKDITQDKVGSGGSRRGDGTLSAQYKNPIPYDAEKEEAEKAELKQLRQEKYEREYTSSCDSTETSKEDDKWEKIDQWRDSADQLVDLAGEITEWAVDFIKDNPEIARKVGKIIQHPVSSFKEAIGHLFEKKTKTIDESETAIVMEQQCEPLVEAESAPLSENEQKSGQKTMTVDEARNEVIDLVTNYLQAKYYQERVQQNIEKLSNASIEGTDTVIEPIQIEELLSRLELDEKKYPELMDSVTLNSVLSILSFSRDEETNTKIKEALKILA